MYQCLNSPKCISVHRLMDNMDNCPYGDDEDLRKNNNSNAIEQMERNSFYCIAMEKYIPSTAVGDGKCDCDYVNPHWCDDENLELNYIRRFVMDVLNFFIFFIDGRNETGETGCEQWPCKNIYTRCNGWWNCPNGEDENGCYQPPSLSFVR